jgi:dihydrofolate reductase
LERRSSWSWRPDLHAQSPAARSRGGELSIGDVRERWDRQCGAKAAAGDRSVLVHGAYTAERALEAGVLDEFHIHQIPVLFGGGRRLF